MIAHAKRAPFYGYKYAGRTYDSGSKIGFLAWHAPPDEIGGAHVEMEAHFFVHPGWEFFKMYILKLGFLDGIPGLAGFGEKSASLVIGAYGHLENIPTNAEDWDVAVRGAAKLAATLASQRADADLFKVLATVRTDADVGTVEDWQWTGPTADFPVWCKRFGWPRLARDAATLATARKS